MLKSVAIAGAVACFLSSVASAQSIDQIIAMHSADSARLDAQIAATRNSIVQSNMNNPAVMAMYQQHLAQGGRMTPQQFAYSYAATGGFTAQGYRNLMDSNARINAQQKAAIAGYQAAQQAARAALAEKNNRFIANMQEAGRVMTGHRTYYDQTTGQNVVLNYLPSASPSYSYGTGQYYSQNQHGKYYASPGNGWWTEISPSRNAPR